jgi:hypothetical protein
VGLGKIIRLLRGFGDNGYFIPPLAQRFGPIVYYVLKATYGGEGLGGVEEDVHYNMLKWLMIFLKRHC